MKCLVIVLLQVLEVFYIDAVPLNKKPRIANKYRQFFHRNSLMRFTASLHLGYLTHLQPTVSLVAQR